MNPINRIRNSFIALAASIAMLFTLAPAANAAILYKCVSRTGYVQYTTDYNRVLMLQSFWGGSNRCYCVG